MAAETESAVGGWYKSWIATLDDRSRDSHAAMDGKTVPRNEPFAVDYSLDGRDAGVVEEDYPGESEFGIQCRCDYELVPAPVVEKAKQWRDVMIKHSDANRKSEVEAEHGRPLHELFLNAELRVQRNELSRTQAAKDLGIGKMSYYDWLDGMNLKEAF